MTKNSHLRVLQFRHDDLETRIANENKRPLPNFLHLRELKRRKLRIKEELCSIMG